MRKANKIKAWSFDIKRISSIPSYPRNISSGLSYGSFQRFAKKIERIPFVTCWLWSGATFPNGYGATSGGEQLAHRASWRHYNGPIPKGMQVLHRCDVPACVNPEHLFLGTAADNHKDKVAKGRQARGAQHSEAIKRGLERSRAIKEQFYE